MRKNIRIKGLDCAACAAELSAELEKIEGITYASADFINQRVSLDCENDAAFERAADVISHFEDVEIVGGNAHGEKKSHRKEIFSVAVSAVFFAAGLALTVLYGPGEWDWSVCAQYDWKLWLGVSFCLASFVAAGWRVVLNAGRNTARAFKNGFHPSVLFDENLLMLIAGLGAIALGQFTEAAAVVLLYQIGEILQSLAVGSSRGAIEKLMEMKSGSAIRLTADGQEEVEPEALEAGDILLIRKGDKIPADCRMKEGESELDTKSLTGESDLREVKAGDEILAGCVNAGNPFKAEVLRPYTESAVAKILGLVENSSSAKAPPEKFITKFSRIYTPAVVLLAVLIAVIPPLFQGFNFLDWLAPSLNFLVISCPCALIISVPLTYFSGVGALAREGVLTKGAVYLDKLASVRVAAFDKTGTLTEGKFSVENVTGGEKVLLYAAAAERNSSHPLAQAFSETVTPYTAEEAEEIAGLGIACKICGARVLVGSARLLRGHGVDVPEEHTDTAVIYVAENGVLIGKIGIADKVRANAAEALSALKKQGVKKLAVLTGDSEERAEAALAGLPVDEIRAQLLPADKPRFARELKREGTLLYVGDGINDTPVMAESDVSAAMGALGSDAAIEASDFVLAGDDLTALAKAVKAAKKTRKIVMENIVFSLAVKAALMVLSLFGFLPLWAAVFGDVGVMLLAVLNSMRMRRKITL